MTTPPPAAPKRLARLHREWNELLEHGIGVNNTIGAVAAIVGATLTLFVALSKVGSPFVLALIAIALQFAASVLFAKGRNQPSGFEPEKYARSALAHLSSLARQAGDAVESTQKIIEEPNPNSEVVLERLRRANVEFSYMREWAIDAGDDWLRVLDEPLKRQNDEQPPNNIQGQNEIGTST